MTEDNYDGPDDSCPACHGTSCCGAGPHMLAEARKSLADERAERILLESALVDALGTLAFYGASDIFGHRARTTMDRIFERCVAFARVQNARPR